MPEDFTDLLERRTLELKTVLEGEVFAEGECQVLLHSLNDDAYWVVVDVLQVSGDDVGVVSAEVVEEDWNFQGLVVPHFEGGVCATPESSSQMVVIPHFVFVFDILTIPPGIEFEGSMTEAALH